MYYYHLSVPLVLIAVLVANTIAVTIDIPDDTWNELKESAGRLCACSNFIFETSIPCEYREAYRHASSDQLANIDAVCKNIKKIAGMVLTPPYKPVNNKLETTTKADHGENTYEMTTKADDGENTSETTTKADDGENTSETTTKADDGENTSETTTKADDGENTSETMTKADDGENISEMTTKLDDDKNNIVTPHIDVKNKTITKGKPDDDGSAGNPDHLKNYPPKEDKTYALPIVLAILFCSFGAGVIVTVGGKLAYDRYRKRSYVLSPEQGMQL